MLTPSTDSTDLLLDLKALQEDVIPIETEYFERAIRISKQATSEARQWQTYLNVLALCGFERWLTEQAGDLPIDRDICSVLQPQYANVLDAVCNLKIGELNLCLIVTESLIHEMVTVPRAVIDLPEFAAHLYVLIEVREEQEQVIIRGCLRYDQLVKYQQAVDLKAGQDWNYQVPLDLFNLNANHLLFFLRFLDSTAIPLPKSESLREKLSRVRADLEERLPQLQSGTQLWQVLTWEQSSAVLACPPLLNLLYLLQTKPEKTAEITNRFADVLIHLVEQVVNVWQWSQGAIDELSQRLAWSMPQALTPASAMRRSADKFEAALEDLIQSRKVEIPPQAHYAYKSIEGILQFCAVTWLLPSEVATVTATEVERVPTMPDWALLSILVAQPGSILPPGIKLQVGTTTVLAEAVLETDDLYLYILVEGSWDEEFVVTIMPPDELPLTLPTFICNGQ